MKISRTFVVCSLVLLLLGITIGDKMKAERKVRRNATTPVGNVTYVNPEPVNVTDPQGTVLYQFALGIADILVSDPNAATECQLQHWMIDQPSIQNGTIQWYEDMAPALEKLKGLLDVYALQAICNQQKDKLQGWLAGALPIEKERHDNATKKNITYDPPDYPDPYANQSEVQKDYNATQNGTAAPAANRRRVFLAKAKKAAKAKAQAQSQSKKNKLKSKLTKAKDWWGVLSLSLPLAPYYLTKFKIKLEKYMKGFLYVQANEFIDCIARSPDTPKEINDSLVGYRSLMAFLKTGYDGFANVVSVIMCNWNRFIDFADSLSAGVKETTDPKKQWYLFGQAWGKFVVAVGTAVDSSTPMNKNKKKK